MDVGVLDFAPNTGMAPLSANQRGASTSAASRPMGSQRNILLLDFLVEEWRHEHPPSPRPISDGREIARHACPMRRGRTRDGSLPPVKKKG